MSIETELARYAAQLQIEEIPRPAIDAFCDLFLDTAGDMLAGYKDHECRRIAECFTCWGGAQVCSVAGNDKKAPPPAAAFTNGLYAHWCEWDDTHDASHVHGSAVIFPALLAAAESVNLDRGSIGGHTLAAAAVAAFDIACRIGRLLKLNSHRGWMPTGSGGTLGAAAGAARVLGLDEKAIQSAMGIAAAGAGLFRQALADKTNGKNILAGIAAKNALEAALLARAGVVGAPNFLTGPYGLHALHARQRGDAALLTAALGERFSITEVSIKPYPSCRSTHPAVDAVMDLLAEDPSIAKQVVDVHVTAPEGLYERCGAPFKAGNNPRVAAQFSMPFTIALALRQGKIRPEDFAPQAILSDKAGIADLIPNVTVEPMPLPPGSDDVMTPVTLRCRLSDGKVIEKSTTALRGSPERPLNSTEKREKLKIAASGLLSIERMDELIAAARALPEEGPAAVLQLLRQVNPI